MFHIPDEVHPQLPSPNQTIHEMPTGKIGVYTRFFEYTNFRLPLSTFLVNVLKHYRIHISQLSVIGAAKVSHFEILCRIHGFEPTVGLFRCFYVNSKNKGWMSFSKRSGTDVVCYTKPLDSLKGWNDHFSRSTLLLSCPISMAHWIGERERDEDEPKLLETTVGRVVSLLPVSPDRSSGELEASPVNVITEAVVEDVAPAELQRKKKRKTKVVDAVQHLLVGAVQHAKVRGGVMPTLPFVSSSVSTTPEREGGDHAEFLAGANLRTLESPQRFVILSDSSDHSGANITEAEVDSIVRTFVPIMTSATTATPTADPAATTNERLIGSSVFGGDSSFTGGSHPISGGFSDRTSSDFLVGGIHTIVDHDSNLQRVYVPQWNLTNGFLIDDEGVCRKMADEFPPNFFASIRGMKHDQLFTEFNVGAAHQISLSAEVRMRAEYNIKEKKKAAEAVRLRDETQTLKERNINLEKEKSELEVKVTDLTALVKVREQKVADLDVVVISVKLQNDSLADKDEKVKEVNEKFDKLCVDFVDMTLHLEEKFYPHILTTIFGRRWLLTHGMELAIAKFLNSTEYLSALGAAIGKAIKKGMQKGLSPGITHGAGSVNFPLIAKLKTNKDASVEVIMNLLRLEDALAEKLGLVESQPHVDQLMVHIHYSSNQRVVALRGNFVPLSKPLSAMDLEGAEGTSGAAPDTTTALSVTSIYVSTIPPISTDDYEIAHTKGGEGAVADVEAVADEGEDLFPNVSGAELDVPE
nr:hypothetical protein [Tanacetum cinerariifolium]